MSWRKSNQLKYHLAWWRHQMEIFSTLLAFCAGNSLVTGEFPAQRPVMRSFDVLFDLHLNKRLNKQSWGWWFETPSRSLWRHCNGMQIYTCLYLFFYVWVIAIHCCACHCNIVVAICKILLQSPGKNLSWVKNKIDMGRQIQNWSQLSCNFGNYFQMA